MLIVEEVIGRKAIRLLAFVGDPRIRRVLFYGIQRSVIFRKQTNVSEKHMVFILRVEE
jgi:hypothetical protein